jgi:hypothetical protein
MRVAGEGIHGSLASLKSASRCSCDPTQQQSQLLEPNCGAPSAKGISATWRLLAHVDSQNRNAQQDEAAIISPKLMRQNCATASKATPWPRRAPLRVPFCNRHLQRAKPFVYRCSASDAKLTLCDTPSARAEGSGLSTERRAIIKACRAFPGFAPSPSCS